MRLLLAATLALAAWPAAPGVAAPAPITAKNRITEVTVYPDRAQVTRTASLSLRPGTYEIHFNRLPYALQADTVRVRGAGTAHALIHGFEIETAYLGHAPDKAVAGLEAKLQAIADQERAYNDRKEVHQRQLSTLVATSARTGEALAKQLAAGKAKLKEWQALLAFLKSQELAEAQSVRVLDQSLRKLNDERRKVKEQLAKLRGFRAERVRDVPVTVEVTEGGTLDLALDYVMPGARWSPAYDARLDAAGEKLDWRYYGVVRQETGEDWQDVHLRLSTASPAAGSRRPDVPSWFLSLWRPEPKPYASRKQAMPAQMAPAPAGAVASEVAMDEREDAAEPVAMVVDQGTSVTLEVRRPVTIPSDGESHQAPIGQADFAARPGYVAVPRVSSYAYLEVATKNAGPWPLLPGPVKAFVGRDYVATTPLAEDVQPGAAFKVPMGVDRGLEITRQRLAKETGTAGLIQKVNYADYRYEVTVANHKPRAQSLVVVEPVPQSTSEYVKIKVGEANREPAKAEKPGELRWTFKLAPSEKQVLRWGYRVEYPQDQQISGLE